MLVWNIIRRSRINLLIFWLLACSSLMFLVGISAVPVIALRYWLLPEDTFTIPLDFVPKTVQLSAGSSQSTSQLVALLDLSSFDSVTWHDYGINLELEMPRSPQNLALGNFMIRGSLNQRDWRKSSVPPADETDTIERMGVMPYKSDFIEKMGRVLFSPLYVFGIMREQSVLNVPLWRIAQRPKVTHPYLLLTLPPTAMVSQAFLRFNVKLSGLHWLLRTYPVFTTVVGTSAVFTSALLTILTLLLITYNKVSKKALIKKNASLSNYNVHKRSEWVPAEPTKEEVVLNVKKEIPS